MTQQVDNKEFNFSNEARKIYYDFFSKLKKNQKDIETQLRFIIEMDYMDSNTEIQGDYMEKSINILKENRGIKIPKIKTTKFPKLPKNKENKDSLFYEILRVPNIFVNGIIKMFKGRTLYEVITVIFLIIWVITGLYHMLVGLIPNNGEYILKTTLLFGTSLFLFGIFGFIAYKKTTKKHYFKHNTETHLVVFTLTTIIGAMFLLINIF